VSFDIDWMSLVFESGWMQKLDQLAAKRFGAGGLAEEAGNYVIEQLSSDNWASLASFKGQCKPETYLHTITNNYLEEFSRKRFGRPRPPEWLKRQGELWVQVWKLVCLERQMMQSVVDHLSGKTLREPGFIKHVITTIKARLPWCGESNREIMLETQDGPGDEDFDPVDRLAHEQTPGDEISQNRFTNTLLMVASLFNDDPTEELFNETNIQHADTMASTSIEKLQALRERLNLTDEERILLRMVYQDGLKKTAVAKSLGMQEHLPGRILKRVLVRISEALQEVGIDMDEIRELSVEYSG
jgi:RNA polymerase sigma factor (sigma-70 family)